MLPPELPPLPALTRAEGELVDRYLEVLDLLGRINPARAGDTYGGLRAAQALVAKAAALRDALALMHQRGESRAARSGSGPRPARAGRRATQRTRHGPRPPAAARLTPGPPVTPPGAPHSTPGAPPRTVVPGRAGPGRTGGDTGTGGLGSYSA